MVKIAPSILTADFLNLGEQIAAAEQAGVDYIHVDVMDGRFVPNLTIGPLITAALRRATSLPLDVHLMIVEPERYIEDFAKAGADIITVHQEVSPHLHRTLQAIRDLGCRAGVSINPATPVNTLDDAIYACDLVLVMTVNPGFGGQSLIPEAVGKISQVRQMVRDRGLNVEIEADGGINARTIASIVQAGAETIVAGSAVYRPGTSVADAVAELRAAVAEGSPV
ncbi:MAG TPA: ribulose-phosphate 3-epimerase [Nitrolancea sp.]|nr:ribulose-phosphate 3-epimerase [Nitrolancea sp.]